MMNVEAQQAENCEEVKIEGTLDQQLQSLRKNLLCFQDQLKKAETDISASTNQISTIETLINKRNQIASDFLAAQPGLKTRHKNLSDYYAKEKACLENILNQSTNTVSGKSGTEQVKCIFFDEKGRIEKLKEQIECLKIELEGKCPDGQRSELVGKQDKLNETKKIYDFWIDPVKSINDRFKKLDDIKKQIDQQHTAGNNAVAYYLLELSNNSYKYYLQVEKPLLELDKKPEDLIKPAWDSYRIADEEYNKINAKIKSLEVKLETTEAQLNDKLSNFEANIQRRLNNYLNEDCGKEKSEPQKECS